VRVAARRTSPRVADHGPHRRQVLGVGEGAHVSADAELRPVAEQEHRSRALRPVQEGRREVEGEARRERVARVGTVEGDPPDVAVQLGQHGPVVVVPSRWRVRSP
jgi:hypothetical protein